MPAQDSGQSLEHRATLHPADSAAPQGSASLTVFVVSVVILSALGAGLTGVWASAVGKSPLLALGSSENGAPSNVSYCNLLGAWSGLNSTGYNISVHQIWSKLCVMPLFQTVINDWGGLILGHIGNTTNTTWVARNLTFGESQHGNSPPIVDFTVGWVAACQNASLQPGQCTEQETWEGNVTTLNLTGPFTSEYRATTTGGPETPTGVTSFTFLLILLIAIVSIGVIGVAVLAVTRGRGPRNKTPPTDGRGPSSRSMTPPPPASEQRPPSPPKPAADGPTGEDRLDDLL